MTTMAAVLLLWIAGRHAPLPRSARLALHALLAAAALQFALGLSTLLLVVPIPLAAAHQAGAVLLLTAAIVLRHTLRRPQLDAAAPGHIILPAPERGEPEIPMARKANQRATS